MSNIKNDVIITTIKAWLTPILISIVGIMLWSQLTELKQDVKKLLAYQSANDVKVSMLEKEIYILREKYDSQAKYFNSNAIISEKATAKKEDEPKVPTPEDSNM